MHKRFPYSFAVVALSLMLAFGATVFSTSCSSCDDDDTDCETDADCVLSRCTCSCWPRGDTPEARTGEICGIPCELEGGSIECRCSEEGTCITRRSSD